MSRRTAVPNIGKDIESVEYLDAIQSKAEAIRRRQAETQQEIRAMTGAVLKRAFRGEL
ncbi:MAG: hypothetical protein H8D43_04530 [Chloroflexi bacterium]|nr:hypothetical protein [Chloroflexota bacterium]